MSRYSILLLVLISGCSSASADMRPFVAVAGRYSLMAAPKTKPKATVCENCRGLGYLTDGKIRSTCPACNGTGKPVVSVLMTPIR